MLTAPGRRGNERAPLFDPTLEPAALHAPLREWLSAAPPKPI